MVPGDWTWSYIGIPFVDRGLTRDGCDCWGLFRLIVLEQSGLKLPEYPDIAAGASLAKLRAIIAASEGPDWIEVGAGEERALDCVLMRGLIEHDGHRHSRPIHMGCVVEPGTLIHIEAGAGVTVVDYRRDMRVKNRVSNFYRYRVKTRISNLHGCVA